MSEVFRHKSREGYWSQGVLAQIAVGFELEQNMRNIGGCFLLNWQWVKRQSLFFIIFAYDFPSLCYVAHDFRGAWFLSTMESLTASIRAARLYKQYLHGWSEASVGNGTVIQGRGDTSLERVRSWKRRRNRPLGSSTVLYDCKRPRDAPAELAWRRARCRAGGWLYDPWENPDTSLIFSSDKACWMPMNLSLANC